MENINNFYKMLENFDARQIISVFEYIYNSFLIGKIDEIEMKNFYVAFEQIILDCNDESLLISFVNLLHKIQMNAFKFIENRTSCDTKKFNKYFLEVNPKIIRKYNFAVSKDEFINSL